MAGALKGEASTIELFSARPDGQQAVCPTTPSPPSTSRVTHPGRVCTRAINHPVRFCIRGRIESSVMEVSAADQIRSRYEPSSQPRAPAGAPFVLSTVVRSRSFNAATSLSRSHGTSTRPRADC